MTEIIEGGPNEESIGGKPFGVSLGDDPKTEAADATSNPEHNASLNAEAATAGINKGVAPGKSKVCSLDDIPAVRGYLRRIGAAAKSLDKAVVHETEGRYAVVLATIRFAKDGKVAVYQKGKKKPDSSENEFLPTLAEQTAITEAWAEARFPEYSRLPVKSSKLPERAKEAKSEDVFRFVSSDGNELLMVQVRFDSPDGIGKSYITYTYWDDHQWRSAEPPGGLPLWGLDQLKSHRTVFIHEGAKSARHCRWMAEGKTKEAREARKAHPWGEQLIGAAHVGWIGGAPNPWRTDWSALGESGVDRVYVVLDNDNPGVDAITSISRALSRWPIHLSRIQFDDRFPSGFDLANAFPMALYGEDGVYSGPSMLDCTFPATWATRQIANPSGTGRPHTVLRKEFARLWAVVEGEGKVMFVDINDTRRKVSASVFNSRVRPISHVKDTATLMEQQIAAKFDGLVYRPGEQAKVLNGPDGRELNCHVAPRVRGDPNGDPAPWLDYLEEVFPNKHDRDCVMRFVATLIARPEVRMTYGLLLFSLAQGTGKSTLYEVLRRILGDWNCSVPSEANIMSDYNEYLVEKRLVFVNEIYSGMGFTAYNKLKSLVTDAHVTVSQKYVPEYQTDMMAHFILCSNSPKGLSVQEGDRRFLAPEVTEQVQPVEFWTAFYAWLDGNGPAIIERWAADYVSEHGHVRSGELPPMTERKKRLIEDSRSASTQALLDLAEAAKERDAERDKFVALDLKLVCGWLNDQSAKSDVDAAYVSAELQRAGLFVTRQKSVTLDRTKWKRRYLTTRVEAIGLGGAVLRDASVAPSTLLESDM